MKWVLIGIGVIVAVGAIVLIAGSIIPRDHRASSRITVAAPIDTVWSAVRDMAGLTSFWADMKKVERLADRNGKETWSQTMKNGFDMPIVITEENPPTSLTTTIDGPPGSPFGGRWLYRLEPANAGGTQITLTEDGWIDNKFFRVVSRVTGYHGTLDSYLRAVNAKFGGTAAPTHVP